MWAAGRQVPDVNLMRFVSRRFAPPRRFLDIGSGEGANARELTVRGYLVHSIDKDAEAEASVHADIHDIDFGPVFDLIYDINTLCHVEDPPFEKIKSWLKPEGIFFSICPTERTHWPSVARGKDFTRFARHSDLRSMFHDFPSYEIHEAFCPDFMGNYLESWIVEARNTASKAE